MGTIISQKHALLSASQFVTPLLNGRRVIRTGYIYILNNCENTVKKSK